MHRCITAATVFSLVGIPIIAIPTPSFTYSKNESGSAFRIRPDRSPGTYRETDLILW
jgi:hypothetical protein